MGLRSQTNTNLDNLLRFRPLVHTAMTKNQPKNGQK